MRRSWLIPAVIALMVAGSAAPARADDSITGRLVDHACYIALGRVLTHPDLVKCSIDGARKGQRLALINKKGDVYLVTGVLAENNNKKLLPLINREIVLTGVLGWVTNEPPASVVAADTRRNPRRDGEVVQIQNPRMSHYREGDPRKGAARSLAATRALDLLTKTTIV